MKDRQGFYKEHKPVTCYSCGTDIDSKLKLSDTLNSMLGVVIQQRNLYNMGMEEVLATIIQESIDKHDEKEKDLEDMYEKEKERAKKEYIRQHCIDDAKADLVREQIEEEK